MNAPITYTPDLITFPTAGFERLWNELAWLRHERVPRREYFVSRMGKPYAYGRAEYARTYLPQPSHPVIDALWHYAELMAECRFDVCFLNGYEDAHDQLGWHADDSPEMDDKRPIAVISLMQNEKEAREIWLRARGEGQPVEKLALASGSMLLMHAGMQDTHVHRIPKASFRCGARVSLTFRGYAP